MTSHATLAERYWTTYLPSRVEEATDPDALWRELAQQVYAMVAAALPKAEAAVKAEMPNATYPELVGLLRSARSALEEDALRQIVLLDPEPGTEHLRMPGTVLEGWDR